MAAGQLRAKTTNENNNETLYSISSSRNELKNARSKQQKKLSRTSDEVELSKGSPPRRSLSALEDPAAVEEGVTLGVDKTAPSGGVKLELRMANKTKSKRTLDDLISSHHRPSRSNHHRRRQHLTAKGTRDRMGLRKSLSYGQMQDLTRSFHMTDLMDLKQSLHGLQEQRQQSQQQQSTAEKLANMFESAIQKEKASGEQQRQNETLLPGLRKLILDLTVDNMATIVQHLEECQTLDKPVQWDLLQSVLDPDHTMDWEKDVFRHLKKSSHSQACWVGEEASYEECPIESSLCSEDSQASWLISDEGQDYDPTTVIGHDDDDDGDGMSLDAYTIHCDSSISLEDFETFEESFALDTAHERILLEVGESWKDSVYEIVEESVAMNESIYMEESVCNDESFYFEESVHTTQSMAKPQTAPNKLLSQPLPNQQSGLLYFSQSEDQSEEEEQDLFEGIQAPLRREVKSPEKGKQPPRDQIKVSAPAKSPTLETPKNQEATLQQSPKSLTKSMLGDQINLPLQKKATWEEKTKPNDFNNTASWQQKPDPGEKGKEVVSAKAKQDDTRPESVLEPSPPSPQLNKAQDSFRMKKTKRVSALITMWERKSKR